MSKWKKSTACEPVIPVNGAAIIAFTLALPGWGRRFALTALSSTLFDISMLSNGMFTAPLA